MEQEKQDTWQTTPEGLYRRFEFKDFRQAFAFMERVAQAAEAQNHHPKWLNEWNVVEIWLSTHDAGDQVTEQDRTLAAVIDTLEAL